LPPNPDQIHSYQHRRTLNLPPNPDQIHSYQH
jgi:hypothetical protein